MTSLLRASSWLLLPMTLAACAVESEQSEHHEEEVGEAPQAQSNVCPGDSVKGIDIASFQHPNGAGIDWGAVAGAEKFVIIKATEKTGYVNSYYAGDIAAARAHGLIAGSYHFLAPSSQSGASGAAQAQHFLDNASIEPGDLPPMLDVETSSLYNSVLPSVADIKGWLDTVEAAVGRKPMVYIGYYVIGDLGTPALLKDYAINIPNYSNCPSYPDSYPIENLVMWQHTSTASVPGIQGHVDENKFYGNMDALLAFAHADQPGTGYLDHADCDGVAGWGWDPDQKDTPTHVDLYFNGPAGADGATGVRTNADQNRDDLCTAIGSCNHGFSTRLPRALFDGASHDVHGYAIDLDGTSNGELHDSPKTVQCQALGIPANTVKRWVTDPATFDSWSFNSFTDVASIDDPAVDAEPDGADVNAAPVVVKADDGTPEVWVIDQGYRRHVINGASLDAWRFAVASMPSADVYANPIGIDWPATPDLIKGSGPKVYVLDAAIDPSTSGPSGSTGTTNPGSGSGSGTGAGGDDDNPFPNQGCSVAGASGSDREDTPAWLGAIALGLLLAKRRGRRSL